MTIINRLELDPGWQCQRVNLDGVQPRLQTINAVLAVLVGDNPGAILHVQLDAPDGPLTVVLQVITIRIHIDLTEQHGLVRKHAFVTDFHFDLVFIGAVG